MIKKITFLSLLALAVFILLDNEYAKTSSGFTRNPNNGIVTGSGTSCQGCHGSNSTDVEVLINFNGGTNEYIPGNTYDVSITISQPAQQRFGFAMVSTDAADNEIGNFIAGADSELYSGFPRDYIGHDSAVSNPSTVTYNFQWTAPATGVGDVSFHSISVAANGNSSTSGDFTKAESLTISEAVPPTPSTQVQLSALIEGAYAGGSTMVAGVNYFDNFPTSQPFSGAPWNYNDAGNDDLVDDFFPPNTIDWVLVEVYDDFNNAPLERQAGLLLADGTIVDVDGISPLNFFNLTDGNSYQLILRTRGHLALATAVPISLPNATPINFSDPTQVLDGVNQLKTSGDGNFLMYAGDWDSNGVITVADFNGYRADLEGLVGVYDYLDGDFSYDGTITIDDFNLYQPNTSIIGVDVVRY